MAKIIKIALIIGFFLGTDAYAADASTLAYSSDVYAPTYTQPPVKRTRRSQKAVQPQQTDLFSQWFSQPQPEASSRRARQVTRRSHDDEEGVRTPAPKRPSTESQVSREGRTDRAKPVEHKERRRVAKAPPEEIRSAGRLTPGEKCSSRDRDPLKCMACVIKGEDNNSFEGAVHGVAANVQERVSQQYRGRNICEVVHASGQYVGAWGRLPRGSEEIAQLESRASAGLNVRGNGMLGFRSYRKKGSVQIGTRGNWYTKRAEDEGLQEQIKQQDDGRFQTAELQTGTAVN